MIVWELRREDALAVLELLQTRSDPERYGKITEALKELIALEKLSRDQKWP